MSGRPSSPSGPVVPTRPRPGTSGTARALATYLEAAVAEAPDHVAIIGDDGSETDYATLAQLVRQAAELLRREGVTEGDVVAVQAPNVLDTAVWMWATWYCGAIVCPIVMIYREREVGFIIGQARPKVFVTMTEYRGCRHVDLAEAAAAHAGVTTSVLELGAFRDDPRVAELQPTGRPPAHVDRDADAAALLLYTSGTTADPKGVIHSSATLVHEAHSIAEISRFDANGVSFMPSPLTHVTGLLYGVVMPVLTRGTSVLLSQWDPVVAVEMVDRHTCTLTVGATPFLRGMVDALSERPHLRHVDVFICGGADIPAPLIEAAWNVGMRAVRTYGSSEMPTATIGDPFGDRRNLHLDEGHAIGEAEVRIVSAEDDASDVSLEVGSIGELEVRGPELFLGYADASLNDAFTADGFFRTGDLARITERGTVEICGRTKDLINRGGEKFSARDVENVLGEHPGIQDVAVVGVPDPVMVERACAFIVPDPATDVGDLSTAALARFVVDRGYPIQKAPEHVRLVEALPRTASGKVRKFELKDSFERPTDLAAP